jgi:hypothetical protein
MQRDTVPDQALRCATGSQTRQPALALSKGVISGGFFLKDRRGAAIQILIGFKPVSLCCLSRNLRAS